MIVRVKILTNVHQAHNVNEDIIPPTANHHVEALADTGCQTCTAGADILRQLKIDKKMLVPSCHRIAGITDTTLRLLGALMLEIRYGNKVTHQMVHISDSISGLYLSETALKELGLIHPNFPDTPHLSHASPATTDISNNDESPCQCIPRAEPPERPSIIPFEPTKENVPKLEEWLLKAFEASAFNTCTHQPLQKMTGEPVRIVFKEGARPFAVYSPITVPVHWEEEVFKLLNRLVDLGIIERVPQGTYSEWCSRMVVVAKKDGTPRITVDLQKLNEASLRETHHTPTPFQLVSRIPPNTIKSVCDAWNGYHSLELAEESRDATTFITQQGRYRFLRAPMGLHTSGDAYTRRYDDITADVDRAVRCVDDSLLWDNDIETAFWHMFDYLHLCACNGLVFTIKKFVFGREILEFAGFEVTLDGYRPPEKILASIRDFPKSKDITGVRAWFGLVNQVAYAFAQAEVMAPFRDFLKSNPSNMDFWDETMDHLLACSKEEIVRLIQEGVKAFEKNKPTCLATDWSRTGVGFTLTQKHCKCKSAKPDCGNGHWKIVLMGSRFAKEAEKRYARIEGEALAVVHGLQSCKTFVLGHPHLIIAVDHKPLIKILNDRSMDSIENPRLLRLKEKTLMYRYEIVHVPGKSNAAPDAASRYPTHKGDEDVGDDGSKAFATNQRPLPGLSTKEVENAAASDEECFELCKVILDGFPASRNLLPENLRYYWPMKDSLFVIGNIPFKGKKMLIPK